MSQILDSLTLIGLLPKKKQGLQIYKDSEIKVCGGEVGRRKEY